MAKCCRSDLNSPLARLPCYLLKGPLKQDFLDIYIETSFGIRQLKNTSAMRVILFLKMFKIEINLENAEKNKKSENFFRF